MSASDVNLFEPTELFVNDPSTCIFTRNLWSCIWRNLRLEIAQKSLERVPLSYAFQNKKHRTAYNCLTPQLCFRLSAVLCDYEHLERRTYCEESCTFTHIYYILPSTSGTTCWACSWETFYTKTFLQPLKKPCNTRRLYTKSLSHQTAFTPEALWSGKRPCIVLWTWTRSCW